MARDVNQQTDDMLSPDDMMMADVNEPTTKEQLVDAAKTVGEVALDMTPIVGDIKAATELPEDIQLIKDLISEGYDEGDIKKMGLGGLFGIATGLGFIPLLGAPADATRIAIKAGVKKAKPPKNKPPVPEFRQKQIDEVKKKYATSAERRKALKAINRPTPKVFHGASGLGEELNTDQIKGLAKDIAYQKKLYTQEPVERMFDGKDALSVDDFVKAIEQPDPSGLPFSVVMADKVSVGSVQPFAAQPKIFRVDPDDGTDGPRFIFMNLKHRDPFDDTLIGESNFAVPIVQGKVLKADLDYVTNRHTEDAYNDIVATITGASRAAKLQKEGFAPYKDFTGAKGLTSKSATGEHFELKEQALSTSRDPLVSMKPGFGNRTLQNLVEADLPPEAVADMSRKQYGDIEFSGELTETMGLDDTTIGASLPKTIHTESEIAVTRPELLNVRRLAEGKPELIRDVEPLTTKKDIPVAKGEKTRTAESTMASRPFQQGPMPEALGQKNVTERVARGQRLVNSIQKRITDLDTSAVDTALKGRPERTINSFYNKTKSLFNELQALGMFTEQYGARGTFDNILEQDILTGDFIGRLGKIARASSKMAEKTGQFGQKEKNLNIMFDTLDALNKNLPKSPTRATKFKEKNSLRGISDAELSSFLFDENPSATTIRKMYKAGLTRSSMFGDVSFGKEVGYDDYKRIIFMMTDRFNEGGLVMAEGGAVPMKEQMELFEEGGMLDQGGTTDPVSGNDVPTGSLQKEVRDDIPAQLSEGEFVMPADVVRYHGLDKMMALRDEAKAGLQRMEDMGQMGNSEEATIPDGIPFNIDDLELDDDPLEMQVGGMVPAPGQGFPSIPPGIPTPGQQGQFISGGVQQSQFANYQPQYTPAPAMPTFDYASYMPAQQQFTPTQTFDTVPTFESYMPRMVTYVDDSGNEMQIPVDQNGNPTIPVPPGFRPKTEDDDATQQQPDTTPPPVTQPVQQRQDDPSDDQPPPTFATAKQSTKTSGTSDPRVMEKAESVQKTEEFQRLVDEIDTRNSFQKFTDNIAAMFGADKAAEYAMAQNAMAEDIAKAAVNSNLTDDQVDELVRETRAALIQGMTGRPAGDFAPLGEKAAPSPKTAVVETARVESTLEAGEVAGQTASDAAKSNLIFLNDAMNQLQVPEDQKMDYLVRAANREGSQTFSTGPEGKGQVTVDFSTFSPEFSGVAQQMIDVISTRGDDNIKSILSSSQRRVGIEAMPTTATVSSARRDFQPIDTKGVVAEETRLQQEAVRKQQQNREEEDRQTQNYRNKGYSESNARKAAKNKVSADNAAKQQARDRGESEEHIARTTAVTDSSGKPVTHTSKVTGKTTVVTNEPEKDDPGPSKIVCTEMYRQTQLDDWKEAIKIWGVYEKKYLTPYHEKGYHWLFMPWVKGMRRSTIMTSVGAYLAAARTQHLKHVMTRGKAPDSIVGNLWCKIVHPLVYVAGRTKEWLKL